MYIHIFKLVKLVHTFKLVSADQVLDFGFIEN